MLRTGGVYLMYAETFEGCIEDENEGIFHEIRLLRRFGRVLHESIDEKWFWRRV